MPCSLHAVAMTAAMHFMLCQVKGARMGNEPGKARVDGYFKAQASGYVKGSERGIWRRWKEREFRTVLKHLEPVAGTDVLEFGCGTGWYARRLIQYGPRRYVATDCLPEMLRHVDIPGVTPALADLRDFSFPGTFHRILCAGALEFVGRPERFFTQAEQILERSGKIVILVPPATVGGRLYKLWHRSHGLRINLFTEDRLVESAARCGLRMAQATLATLYGLVVTLEKQGCV
jgi:SAM-dependent methyltransferase